MQPSTIIASLLALCGCMCAADLLSRVEPSEFMVVGRDDNSGSFSTKLVADDALIGTCGDEGWVPILSEKRVKCIIEPHASKLGFVWGDEIYAMPHYDPDREWWDLTLFLNRNGRKPERKPERKPFIGVCEARWTPKEIRPVKGRIPPPKVDYFCPTLN